VNESEKNLDPRPASPVPLETLAARVRAGDRAAAAEVVARYGPLLRQRIRRKLGRVVRTLFDSEDVVSSVARKLDLAVANGRIDVADGEHLLALIQRMMKTTVVDKSRVVARLRVAEGPDSVWAMRFMQRIEGDSNPDADEALELAVRHLDDPDDRLQFSLWLRGEPHRVAAEQLGISPALARKRWEKIRRKLTVSFTEAAC